MEDQIRACLKSKHNLSAVGLDGVGYVRLKSGGDPIIKLLSKMFKDCIGARRVPLIRKCSPMVLLSKKGKEYEMRFGVQFRSSVAPIVCSWR
jgi:hypothetical protein